MLDIKNSFVTKQELDLLNNKLLDIHKLIHEKKGLGSDFLGWLDLPINYDKKEVEEILIKNKEWDSKKIDTLLVIGIGGSFLGAKAGIDFINGLYKKEKFDKEVIFVGINLSVDYYNEIKTFLETKNWVICIISKSGTTIEPAIAFKFFRELLEVKHKENYNDYIVAITDKNKGVLKEFANITKWKTFIVPDDINGRFSVLTAVGLFPLAFVNIDIKKILEGSKKAKQELDKNNNLAQEYAKVRFILNTKQNKKVESFVYYDSSLHYFAEWLKQLFGESEGKNNKGLFLTSMEFTRDLHSLGQFIQEGSKILFESVLWVNNTNTDYVLKDDVNNYDKLNYLTNKKISWINLQARNGVIKAHVEGQVPNILIEFNKKDELNLGYLFYWFMKACAYSSYLLDINPFDQPGVELYKKNMFKLLGK